MTGSVAFDRAADFYDRTRAVSEDSMARTVRLLAGELRGRGRALELGVGTGLLALPLHEAGVPLAGIDLSAPMLARLVAKAGARAPFPVAIADATRLPFAADSFGGAYLRWVLHLVPDWPAVLGEVVRVVEPGGVFLANLGAYAGPPKQIQDRFAEITGVSTEPVGLTWDGERILDEAMRRLGASVRVLPEIHEGGTSTLEAFLEGIDENRYSWTWPVPDDARLRAAAELRPWVRDRFGPLDERRAFEHATSWRAYDLPS